MSVRIGIVGVRRGGGFATLLSARKDCRVVAVCDRDRGRAEAAAVGVGAEALDDYDRLCEKELDAIVIATPPAGHFECSVTALESGKHVLCEVPAVVTLSEAEQLAAKVKQTGLKYMLAENVCYFPCIQEMHRLVREGRIGRVTYAEGEYIHDCRSIMYDRSDGLGGGTGGRPTWRVDFEPIQYCTHELGPLLMILEDRIVTASCMEAVSSTERRPGFIKIQSAIFETAGGRVIREVTGFSVAREPAHHVFCLYGTKGSIETDRYRWMENLKVYGEDDPDQKEMTDLATSLTHRDAPPEARAGGHGTSEYFMVDDFITSIVEDRTPPIDVTKALEMTVPGICAAMSAKRGGELVQVPPAGSGESQ